MKSNCKIRRDRLVSAVARRARARPDPQRPRRNAVAALAGTALLGAASLSGCAVGPNFARPAPPNAARYTPRLVATTVASPGLAGGDAQRFVAGKDIAADWWTLFRSKPLDALIERALAHNADLKAAQASLAAARESVLAQRGAYYPSISAGFSANRQKQSTLLAPVPNYPAVPQEFLFNLFTPQVSVSYVPDVFGLNRRTLESARAQARAVRFQMIATYDTLVANVVVAAIQEAALRAQLDATQELVDLNEAMLRILRYQFAKGYASRVDLAAQESQLAQTAAALPPLAKALAQQRDLLAVLAGAFPDDPPAEDFSLSGLHLPRELPVSLPSRLVEQRPDVLQAEANLHAASAQIGIAIANRLPNVTLTANTGSTSLAMSQLFGSGTGFWEFGGSIAAPIFEGGALLHAERAAKAAYVEAAEQYRSTVLTAFQNVADTLAALDQDARGLRAAAASAKAARVTLDLLQRQAKAGYASELALINAEQAYQQARVALVQAQAGRYADTAALFQALGGGWWNRPDLTRNQP